MKKTTKILLVLAAVVAMTIGAVSTVMAADFPEVAEWSYNSSTKKYSAKDTDGETIVRGWATDEGRWYFFDSSVMLANTFITYKEDIYYLDNYGCMAIGWIEFKGDQEVNVVDKYDDAYKYENVTEIDGFGYVFEIDDEDALGNPLFAGLWANNSVNKTVWCYFDEHGVMANDEWVQPESGLWYYMYGPYCVMGDYHVAINNVTKDGKWFNDGTDGVYGFDKNGAMLVGWNYVDLGAYSGDKTDADTPYENLDGVKGATRFWTYYYTDGRQVNTVVKTPATNQATYDGYTFEGWEKIENDWYYFIDDEVLGLKALQNTVLFDVNTDLTGLLDPDGQKGTFYLDPDGAMVTGTQSFKKNTAYAAWLEATTTYSTFKVVTGHDGIFYFNDTLGKMEDGLIGKYYYKDYTAATPDIVYLVEKTDITTDGFISIDASNAELNELDGQRLEHRNFFVETVDVNDIDGDNNKTEVIIMYFESGRWQKNQGITFGETTIVINDKGIVCNGDDGVEITIDGFKYKFTDDTTFTIGSTVINGVVRK